MPKKQRAGLAESAIQAGQTLVAVIYNRVSQNRHIEEKSIGEQDAENRDACADEGWQVGRTYSDSVSASRFALKDRAEWKALLAELEAERYHVLVLWEVSRGDRELGAWIDLIDLCRELGVLIHVTSHERTYDVRSPGDWKALVDQGVDAAHEPEKTSKRVTRGVKKAAAKGLPHGRLLYGYRREYKVDDRGRRRLVGQFLDERLRDAVGVDGAVEVYSPAEIVREMAARYASGEPARAIARDLKRRGIPTSQNSPYGWHEGQVKATVTNPGYVGRRVHQGQVLEGVAAIWPPILDETTYQACVARANDPARKHGKTGAIKHLGSGLYLCGVCQGTIRVTYPHGVATYCCWPPAKEIPMSKSYHVGRTKAHVDAYVQMSVWARLARPDIAALLAEDKRANEEYARLNTEIVQKQARLDKARDAYAAGHLGLDGLLRIEQTLLPEIQQSRSRLNEARVGPALRGLVLPTVGEVEAVWWQRSLHQQREVIRVLTERVEILPLGRARAVRRNFTPEESVRIVWRQPRPETVGVD
jgi:DNA invertase Pin-like site-specific DNA recombinase